MLEAKKQGVCFGSTLTLGRQRCNMMPSELADLRKMYKIGEISDPHYSLEYRSYADAFFYHYLNVHKLSVIDLSNYEGADIVHDMNFPISENLRGSFDVVIDGGTLEHIFNFPMAIANCMKMVKLGGSLFIFSMANNHCGHGFYQFSPELFFRIFQPENGFEIRSVILVKHPFPGADLSMRQVCFKVRDPAILGRRSTLVTKSPLGIMVHAQKIECKLIFEQYPQQSDYVSKWRDNNRQPRNLTKKKPISAQDWGIRVLKMLRSRLPLRLQLLIAGFRQLYKSSLKRDTAFYSKWP